MNESTVSIGSGLPLIHPSKVEWILQQMEAHTKKVMYDAYSGDDKAILETIGEFRGLLNLLTNSCYESYGLKFKVILPTNEKYAESLPQDGKYE